MSGGRYTVQIHQSKDSPVGSSYSYSDASSISSTPRSSSVSTDSNAPASSSGKNAVHVHNLKRVGYDTASPSPQYDGGYKRS